MELKIDEVRRICKDIPSCEAFARIKEINKGLSGDAKFRVETTNGQRFLLRISDIKEHDRKKAMYEMMRQASSHGVVMSRPVDFGVCSNGKYVYQLLSWCEGETADAILPRLANEEQYVVGVKAGRNLKKIHSIPAPDSADDWYDQFISIHDERITAFFNCGVHIDGSEAILSFYEKNRRLLRNRPQCFNHGDYHTENLLVSENLDAAVIDWELIDSMYGDPGWEFNRINNGTLFPRFASGQINGYFNGEPPQEFWPVLALYLSTGALMLVSWAVYIEPTCLAECTQTASQIIHWFDGMRNPVPLWYAA
jgi:serine/threonine-protein kinase